MPSANGVYSLPVGYLAVTGATIQASQHNPPLEDIAAALTGRLSRDGTAPMTGPVQAAAGTVGAPSYTFAADNSKGFSSTTAGVGVSVGGTKVAEFTSGGLIGARVIGEIVPYVGTLLPSTLWVFCAGQTLSRTTYPSLWAFALLEISAGNTFFTNGDGSTTFGIGDLRGRVPAGKDNMGGSAANRIGSVVTDSGTIVGTTLGSAGGSSTHALVTAELAAHTHPNTVGETAHAHTATQGAHNTGQLVTSGSGSAGQGALSGLSGTGLTETALASVTITNASQGSGTAHAILQPTAIVNYILFAGN